MQDDRSTRTHRRILVLGMCLSYLGFLASLWYIWNAPRQWLWFNTTWLRIGANRIILIVIPLIIFCGCYLKLRHLAGDMFNMRDKQLDERQRMVRDSAHRTAYKIVTLLFLLVPLYLAAQGLFVNKPTTPPPSAERSRIPTVIAVRPMSIIAYSVVNAAEQKNFRQLTVFGQEAVIHWAYMTPGSPYVSVSAWYSPAPTSSSAPVSPQILPPAGIYYGLVLLAFLLAVGTLPRAIIAWKER